MTQLIITILLVAAILINQYQIYILTKEVKELKQDDKIINLFKDAENERKLWQE